MVWFQKIPLMKTAVVNEVLETKSLTSEEILTEIFNAYKNFSENPALTIDTIWNYAHEDNREATGPKERFSMMLTSEPYNSIVDLKDYSYEVIFESDENIHYEVKVLAKNNNYFVITWVFEKTLCEEKPCWRTIGVTNQDFLILVFSRLNLLVGFQVGKFQKHFAQLRK